MGNNDRRNRNNNDNSFPKINRPLHLEYTNYEELYLPEKKAYQYAKLFSGIPNHQMRKILDTVKSAALQSDHDITNACKQMYIIVAMSAYNAGRMPKLKPLYNFLSNTINERSIKTQADIKTFDQFFTSIVAYHRLVSRN